MKTEAPGGQNGWEVGLEHPLGQPWVALSLDCQWNSNVPTAIISHSREKISVS